jgi:RNA polymerase sigma factor (sigma-70 family)
MSFAFALSTWFNTVSSNEELMLRYADSLDQRCLEKLYRNCADDLYHFLLTLTNPELARDISQLTWLKVIEKKALYRDSGRFSAWLFTLARNLLIDDIRKNGRFCELRDSQLPVSKNNDHDGLLARFERALITLPFEQKEAFCLKQEGFGLQEISDITGEKIETVKSRLRYAKTALKAQLEKDHD